MDCVKIGKLIAALRKEKKLTQKNIADALGIQNKTVSKWECGLGCPDLSYWPELSAILGVNIAQMMEGEIVANEPDNGNIEKVCFYVCSSCGNILFSTGGASVFCCGRKLEALVAKKSLEVPDLSIEEMDLDYYIQFDHPMTKEHYISFAAYVKSDMVFFYRFYPEQSSSLRFPAIAGGILYLYCIKDGLFFYPRLNKII